METSLMVYDYPNAPEEETYTCDFEIYVKFTFKDVELAKGETPKDYIDATGFSEFDDYEIEEIVY